MAAIATLSFLFIFSMAFYLRFLIAMCKECRHQRVCHLVRLRSHSDASETAPDRELEVSNTRAA